MSREADGALREEVAHAADTLDEIAEAVLVDAPDTGRIRDLIGRLPDHVIGAAINAGVSLMLTQAGVMG